MEYWSTLDFISLELEAYTHAACCLVVMDCKKNFAANCKVSSIKIRKNAVVVIPDKIIALRNLVRRSSSIKFTANQ